MSGNIRKALQGINIWPHTVQAGTSVTTDNGVNCFCMNTVEGTALYNVGITESFSATVFERMNDFACM